MVHCIHILTQVGNNNYSDNSYMTQLNEDLY